MGILNTAVLRIWLAGLLLAGGIGSSTALHTGPQEAAVLKATFLRNFVEFVRWPNNPSELRLCVFGHDDLGSTLDALQGLRLQKSALALRRHARIGALNDCHIIFVPNPEKAHLATILAEVRQTPVLVVADIEGAAQLGAGISLHENAGRIGFDVSYTATQAAGLQLSSHLLQLARRVY